MAVARKIHRPIAAMESDAIKARIVRARDKTDAYARDPFKHLEDGHVVILDLESLRPTLLEPWPHQLDLAADWIDLDHLTRTGELRWRNVHEIKSRQMGITWWVAYLYVWALRWHSTRALALSLKVAEIADSGLTTDSFFGRIRYIAEYRDTPDTEPIGGWPEHLRPRFAYTGGNDPIIRSPTTGFVTGVGAIPDPGRGGRYDSAFLDEFARVPYGLAAQASLSRAIPQGRLYNSTVDGEDNQFWLIRKHRPRGYSFRRDHWSQHPIYGQGAHVAAKLDDEGEVEQKGERSCALCLGTLAGEVYRPSEPRAHRFPGKLTSPWYEDAIVELTDPQVAAELDIDPAAALTARVYPEFSEERHVAAIEIAVLQHVPIELSFDFGETTAVTLCQDTPREYRVLGEIELGDALPETVARAIRAEMRALGLAEAETSHHSTLALLARGDPAGEARDQGTGRSIIADYAREGFAIGSSGMGVEKSIRAIKRLLGGRPKELVISQRCPLFIHHMKHYRREVDRRGNPKPGAKPAKDGHDHMMDSFRYLAAWRFPLPDAESSQSQSSEVKRPGRSGRISEGLTYDTVLAVRPRRYNSINGDAGRAYVSGLWRAEEVACFSTLSQLCEAP